MQNLRSHLIQGAKICLVLSCLTIFIPAQKNTSDKLVLSRFEKRIEDGKLAEVDKDLFDYVIANPKDARGFALLAKLRLRQNRLSEAISLANKALTLDPVMPSAKLSLALAHFQLGEIEESRSVLSTISQGELSDTSVRVSAAEVFALVGNCPKALETAEGLPANIRNGDALPIRAACFLELDDKKGFESLIPFAITQAKLNPTVATNFAGVLSKHSLHKETADLLRLVIVSNPRNIDALLLLAQTEIYLKELAKAKIHLAQAEALKQRSSEVLFVRSLLESEQGNYAQSLALLERSLASDPNNIEALAQLVVVAMRANQSGKAVAAAGRLVDLKPEKPEFFYLLGAASLQNNNLQQAETSLTKYLESRPEDSRGCLALGLTFAAQTEKVPAALKQLQHCLEIDPNDYKSAYQLGLLYKTQGESAKAVEYLEQTVRLSPNYAAGLRDLGAAYLQTGAEAKARPVLEKAVLIDPNDADTHFQLSRLYNIIGERELGKKHLEIFQRLKTTKKDGM